MPNHIVEYHKPWNYNRIWLDFTDKQIIIQTADGVVYKYQQSMNIDVLPESKDNVRDISVKLYQKDCDTTILEIGSQEIEDFVESLQSAFKDFEKIIRKFLCSTCKYGQLLRISHEPESYGEGQYSCIDMSKKREYPLEIQKSIDEANEKANRLGWNIAQDSLLDYDDGPGGWDGKTCSNYKERYDDDIPYATVTTNGNSNVHYFKC